MLNVFQVHSSLVEAVKAAEVNGTAPPPPVQPELVHTYRTKVLSARPWQTGTPCGQRPHDSWCSEYARCLAGSCSGSPVAGHWMVVGWTDAELPKAIILQIPPFCLPVKRGKRRKAVSQSNTDRRKPVQLQFLPHCPNPIRQTRPPARVSPQHSHGLVALTEVSICEYLVFPGKLTPTGSKQMSYLFLLLMHPRLALS